MERMSDAERDGLWDRYEAGESFRAMRRSLGRAPSTVWTHVVDADWKRPVAPPEWSPVRLSLGEREGISRGLAEGVSLRCIACRVGRSPSTVSREVTINGGRKRFGRRWPTLLRGSDKLAEALQ